MIRTSLHLRPHEGGYGPRSPHLQNNRNRFGHYPSIMTIVLQKVESTRDTDRFIHFPHQIYSDRHPLGGSTGQREKKFLSPETNPFFDHAEAEYFLALSTDGKTLGRIAAIVDHDHNRFHKEHTGFFGMFECVNDVEVSTLLLNAAEQWCRKKEMDRMRGPLNLSINHECGLLVENFDDPPVLGIPYNPPYYADLFLHWGLKKDQGSGFT